MLLTEATSGNLTELVRTWKQLSTVRVRDGRSAEAVPLLCYILEAYPSDAECLNALGVALHDLGRLDMALLCYRQAIQIKPDLAAVFFNLAHILEDLGYPDAAIEQYRYALQKKTDNPKAFNALGTLLHEQQRWQEALDCYDRALAIQPDYAEALSNRGNTLRALGRLEEALDAQMRALSIQPERAELHANLGTVLQEQGRAEEALAAYSRAAELKPNDPNIASRWLFLNNFAANENPPRLLSAARHFGELVRHRARPFETWPNLRDPHRPLRIGLVSADFHKHPVGYFLIDVLESLHRLAGERLLLHGYAASTIDDALTTRIRACCVDWSVVTTLSDAALAERIRADGIDILVDLSGHTAYNRLPMFAWKPAPIQVTWLGYFATTGLAEIDYLLADPISVPPEQQGHFSEQIWYLPETRLCFSPPDAAPAVCSLPAKRNGYITFGSFQNPAKLNDRVLRLWARVLNALPSARLRLQNQLFSDAANRARFERRLHVHGFDTTRIALHGRAPRTEYLAAHAEVDLILDTFPFPGGTTTCEALWMGVPTLTLAGQGLLARQGASLMTAAGLADWVADNEDEYLHKAIAWAHDPASLAELRAGLRAQVARSPLFDTERFARHLESAFRGMWLRYTGIS
ncbi:O-linked N-acetylglucosamine transferase, SPINDLY family protein [Allochromatium vinosum]|uniref:O-linked N-acetylglucosamine transferase, SPINDLY family protein n=1 Tax=Allochromatium vinosum TaxID=1049 RepID=UPI001F5BB35A|nr:tetratricopeptide repeat protein [Allochromatium vinosum]MBK1656076.1 hypothetical protein [Allochromatium vinosum]